MRTSVGFHDKVTLGELGRIIQNPQEVLRLALVDDATGAPHPAVPEVYLRGAVLTDYQREQWEYREMPSWSQSDLLALEGQRPAANLVRQEITIEPMDRDELFCVWPFLNYRAQPELWYDEHRECLLRDSSRSGDRFSFTLWTTAFKSGLQSDLAPASFSVPAGRLLQMPPRDGPDALPGLVALADRWVREAHLTTGGGRYERARLLERQLRDSGRFQYSLDGPARDLSIDPIEDFITKHPQGHCEYFATALALMLRSQGVPARVMMGYRTDEFNRLGHFYQVRQLHAHAWVEAYLEPSQIPPYLVEPGQREAWRRGAWLRLDATPDSVLAAGPAGSNPVEKAFSWLEGFWTSYVMDMDRPRQREAVYQPLVDWAKTAGQNLTDPDWWWGLLANLARALDPRQWNWLSWRGGLAAILVALVGLLFYRTIRPAWRRWSLRGGRAVWPDRQQRARIAFYRRLEAVLARRGLTRLPSQTQREFALNAGSKLAAATGRPDIADLPAHVVEAFYQVRFGQHVLDQHQSLAVEQAIAELERACQES